MINFLAVTLAATSLVAPATSFLPVPTTWSRRVGAKTMIRSDKHHSISKVSSSHVERCNWSTSSVRGGTRRSGLVMKVKKDPGASRGEEGGDDPRRQALDGVLHQIERCYGKGSILKMGDTTSMDIETTSTGPPIL